MTSQSNILVGEHLIVGFRGYTLPTWIKDFEARHGLGGVLLFDYDVHHKRYERNVESPSQVAALCAEVAALPSHPLVMVDQEGGKVRRLKDKLGFVPLPSQLQFNPLPTETKKTLLTNSYRELRQLGIHFNLAPVIDVNDNPNNPDIGAVERSYSDDPEAIRANALLAAQVATEMGLGLCLKHYPGVGGARTNSHHQLTSLEDCLSDAQLKLFDALTPHMPGQAILVSHGIVPQWEAGLPVSMSKVALQRLRAKLPHSLLLSDDVQMQGLQQVMGSEQACIKGLSAGLDMIIIGNNLLEEETLCMAFANALEEAAHANPTLMERLVQSKLRIVERKTAFCH